MLNVMRENVGKLKWVLAIVAISMVGYLGAFFDWSGDDPQAGNWAAKVGEQKIARDEFIQTARRLDDQYSNLFGESYANLKPQLRIGTAAIEQLISRALILEDAREMGLAVTDEERRDFILETFVDETGKFVGEARYKDLVLRQAPSVPAFEATVVRDAILVDKWGSLVTEALDLSDAELEKVHRERSERTVIDYFVVPAAAQNVDSNVSDADLQRWYDEHTADYHRQEGRDIRLVVIDREAQQAKVELTDADLRGFYNANEARYTRPEERRARQIALRVVPGDDRELIREAAERVVQRLQDGDDFAELAKAMSQDPASADRGGDMGFFARGVQEPTIENAVFGTEVGQLAGLVETPAGFHVLEVTDAREAGKIPFEEVREQIQGALLIQRGQERVAAEAARLNGDLAAGVSLADLATREGLTVQSLRVTRGERVSALGAGPDFTQAVMALNPGESAGPLRVAGGLALVVADAAVPAAVAPLAEVRDQVRSDLLNDRASRAAVAAARKAVDDGAGLSSLATRFEQTVQQAYTVRPGQSPPGAGGFTPELKEALFSGSVTVGQRGVTQVPAGALVYEVMERSTFDAADFAARKGELRTQILAERGNQLQQSIIDRLRKSKQVLIDQQLIGSIDG